MPITDEKLLDDLVKVFLFRDKNIIHFKYDGIKLSEEQAQAIQMHKGYHPAGYGFSNFRQTHELNRTVYKWECSATS